MLIAGIYDFTNWKEEFIEHLKNIGIKPNTAKDYASRIEKIIKEENITIQKLSIEIDEWIAEYKTGTYATINKQKHYAPSSALVKFKVFVPTLCRPQILSHFISPFKLNNSHYAAAHTSNAYCAEL